MPLSRARERLLRRITTRKGREREGVVLVEGPRAVRTALDGSGIPHLLLLREGADPDPSIVERVRSAGIEVETLPVEEWDGIAETETPQGILALMAEPRPTLPTPPLDHPERILLLDRVQDPGNVGTLIRSAAALGATRVVALDGTADPWSGKAVRAAAGTGFLLPVHPLPWSGFEGWLTASKLPLLAALAGGADARRLSPELRSGWVLAVGNEGAGLRPELLERTHHPVSIPMAPGVESLNAGVAGSLLLWALAAPESHPPNPTP